MARREGERIGLVLAGGGARGAYEIGALSVLLPELERLGQRPTVILGTSVGAINTAFLAATANLTATESVQLARERWLSIGWRDVLRPILHPSTALAGLRYAGAALGLPGVNLKALLDPAPLEGTLERWIDWEQLHANAGSDALDAAAVIATSALSARSRVFVEGRDAEEITPSHEIDYESARLGPDHVRASAAIPLAFPAVRLERSGGDGAWFFDGGTRLNTPIKPALDLGVDRVVVVATHSVDPRNDSDWHERDEAPDFGDGIVQLLFAMLVDPLISDVRMLGKINLLVADGGTETSRRYREDRGRKPHREIPYMFIAPPSRDRIGDIAAETFARHHTGSRLVRDPDIAILARLLGGISEPHGELLSYLFFSPEFVAAAIEQGEEDARDWLERDWGDGGPWLTEPIDSLGEGGA